MNSIERGMERLKRNLDIAYKQDVATLPMADGKTIERAMERLNGGLDIACKRDVATPLSMVDSKASTKPHFAPESKAKLQLNFKALARAGYLTPNTMQGDLAEQCRLLKRPVLMNASGRQDAQLKYGNLIVITSALPGEGKTFISFNLAMSIALERDNTVLLIDSDLTRRSLTGLVGLKDALGLTDVLLNPQLSLHKVIVDTNVPKLRLIPAGQTHRDATELLASEQMQAIACELSERYSNRIVLFDAPPLLSTSQTIVLTNLMGQILVVVEEGKTLQPVIQEAVSLLDEDKVVGMVLNRCRRSFGSKYYGYY